MSIWSLQFKECSESTFQLKLFEKNQALSFRTVLIYWQDHPAFVEWYKSAIVDLGSSAFFWEHPPLKLNDLERDYECIIKKSNSFTARSINEAAFADYFQQGESVAVFPNLGRNAMLVVPTKKRDAATYKHLGAFLANADAAQQNLLFEKVGNTLLEELKKGKQIWLNTAGLGVIWLHVRLDTRPKYYKTKRYRDSAYFKNN